MHNEKHEKAGQTLTVNLKGPIAMGMDAGKRSMEFTVEDWWDKVSGISWMFAEGNPACLAYAIRTGISGIPMDDEVVYGHNKENGMGHLVHVSELEI